MSAESTLYGWLSGHAGLTAIVGTRIFPDVIAQGEQLPAIAYARSNTEPVATVHGTVPADLVSLQIQCWSDSRTEADAAADQVQSALASNGEAYTGRSVLFDAETGLFGTAIDVRLLINN